MSRPAVKLAQVCLNSDLRCRYRGLKEQAVRRNKREWWDQRVAGKRGAFVLFVNRKRTMLTLIDGTGWEATHRFEKPVDLGALKTVFLEAFGLELGVGRTFEAKYAAYVERRRMRGVPSFNPRATWTWMNGRS